MEGVEDELRDSVASITQERDDIMEQLSDMQASLASQEAQIKWVCWVGVGVDCW